MKTSREFAQSAPTKVLSAIMTSAVLLSGVLALSAAPAAAVTKTYTTVSPACQTQRLSDGNLTVCKTYHLYPSGKLLLAQVVRTSVRNTATQIVTTKHYTYYNQAHQVTKNFFRGSTVNKKAPVTVVPQTPTIPYLPAGACVDYARSDKPVYACSPQTRQAEVNCYAQNGSKSTWAHNEFGPNRNSAIDGICIAPAS